MMDFGHAFWEREPLPNPHTNFIAQSAPDTPCGLPTAPICVEKPHAWFLALTCQCICRRAREQGESATEASRCMAADATLNAREEHGRMHHVICDRRPPSHARMAALWSRDADKLHF
jgi:hypothetical protein